MKDLTKKQKEIVDFIEDFHQKKGYAPAYRDIMAHFQFLSPGSVYNYAKTLKKKGILPNEKYTRATILKTKEPPAPIRADVVDIPFIGYLTLGFPIETFPQTQSMAAPASMVHDPERTYILQAKDCDLSDESIVEGDLLLVEARQDALAGEIIVGLIHQHDTIVKRFYPEGAYVRLEGSRLQSAAQILKAEDLMIQGVLVGLFSSF